VQFNYSYYKEDTSSTGLVVEEHVLSNRAANLRQLLYDPVLTDSYTHTSVVVVVPP
jgi:hypothetical protein